ncbi:MAG: diaminopimelate decarboxylase [Desulfobulbus sp.]|jgi:diaminopimelate decarboxylase|nr:diaminopimelate decarboxylase [Desulfobulbus sp.]
MPMPQGFKDRLYPHLDAIAAHYGTPFHIYDEAGIRATGRQVQAAFADIPGFREFYAVKALPNPAILAIMRDLGFGFDCSSETELLLARSLGARGEEIMFTSNNTSPADFAAAAAEGGCLLNLDDITLIDKVSAMPELICFRYNPGTRRTGNEIIGKPEEAKYGVSHEQIVEAYRRAMARGAKRFGLHTMLASNELHYSYMVQTASMLLDLVETIGNELGIRFEFINIGGGLGIPYLPDIDPLNIAAMGEEITALFVDFKDGHGSCPALFMESGRYMTGPHGALVTRAINRKEIYRTYVGVDACMSALMRPGMYGAYHHIEVPARLAEKAVETVDVVGALCENNDKFAVQRPLPRIHDGDLVVIHDTGAHGHAMGFNYNGRMRPQELLLRADGTVALIRREERPEDYFATLRFEEKELRL